MSKKKSLFLREFYLELIIESVYDIYKIMNKKTWHPFAMDLLHLYSHFKLNQWKWWQIYDRSDESTHQTNEINDFSKRFKTKAKHRAHREPNYSSNESISISDKKQTNKFNKITNAIFVVNWWSHWVGHLSRPWLCSVTLLWNKNKTETKEKYTTIFWTNLLCDDEIELCSKHK